MYLLGGLIFKDKLYVLYFIYPLGSVRTDILCSIFVFIITILLLAADFYYLKNIAGRRLVGLRWWNEVDTATGNSTWVFESSDPASREGGMNKTDSRFFWLAVYVQPPLWVGLGMMAMFSLHFVWLVLIGECLRFSSLLWRVRGDRDRLGERGEK